MGASEPIGNARDVIKQARLRGYDGSLQLAWFVVSPAVSAIRLGAAGELIPRPDPRLPAGWKAVVTFLPGSATGSAAIEPVPLDSRGRPAPQPGGAVAGSWCADARARR